LAVIGDTIDHALDEEWSEAIAMLDSLHRSGTRVVLAPGNHDLAIAYDPVKAFPFLRSNTPYRRLVDSSKVAF
jgi:UDP-2,3-diacylglucosamine pyrophosphatase LpxH